MTPQKILVTGGAGFIGSHVVKTLKSRYPEAAIRVMHQARENMLNLIGVQGIELMVGDVTRPEDCARAVEGCDAVFHLAAIYALWLPDLSLMDRVNVGGSRNMLEACLKAGVKRVVYTSSYAVYAGQGADKIATEESPFVLGYSHYSRTKYESHLVAKEYARKGLDVVIVCPAMPIGPGDVGPTPTGRVIADMFQSPVTIGIETEGNYVDVRDCAMGHVLALEKGRTGESYILGGENYMHHDVMRRVLRLTGIKRKLITLKPDALMPVAKLAMLATRFTKKAPFTTPVEVEVAKACLIADASKARRELGMTVRPIEETLRDSVAWFIEHGYITDRKAVEEYKAAQI